MKSIIHKENQAATLGMYFEAYRAVPQLRYSSLFAKSFTWFKSIKSKNVFFHTVRNEHCMIFAVMHGH